MNFAPKPGCPMCGIVAYASTSSAVLSQNPRNHLSLQLGSRGTAGTRDRERPDILYRDDNFTIYEEREWAVSSRGHLVVCFNLHVPSLYTLSSSDVPLLIKLQEISTRLLSYFTTTPPASPLPSPSPSIASQQPIHIGFITPPFKDSRIPVSDHLHAHAFIGDMDRLRWYDVARKVVWNAGWWDVADLIAEIREQTSNNRVKSGAPYTSRSTATTNLSSLEPTTRPINTVFDAGTRAGHANGLETTLPSLQVTDLEEGLSTPHPMRRDSETQPLRDEWANIATPRAAPSINSTDMGPRPLTPQPSSGRTSADAMLTMRTQSPGAGSPENVVEGSEAPLSPLH